jgi:hypothetical protein
MEWVRRGMGQRRALAATCEAWDRGEAWERMSWFRGSRLVFFYSEDQRPRELSFFSPEGRD